MDAKTAERLEVGQRLIFTIDGATGAVAKTGRTSLLICWDDGKTSILDHDDMQDVSVHLIPEMPDARGALP